MNTPGNTTRYKKPGVFGISFDAVAISGVIVEFLKIAELFHENNYNIYLDLGYEIKADKHNFFRPYTNEMRLMPSWVKLVKIIEKPFQSYSEILIYRIFTAMISQPALYDKFIVLIENYADHIAERLLSLWHKLNIEIIIVENGTLPENIIFTKALYKAVVQYGEQRRLNNKYVLWRDHDLMWSSETNINKYGEFPYPHVSQREFSKYISYVVLHRADYNAAVSWCSYRQPSILRNNFASALNTEINNNQKFSLRKKFREKYHIPQEAKLIARFTRIIRQKRIDRDIKLLQLLQQRADDVYLFIAGDTQESPSEYAYLCDLVNEFNLTKRVIFGGALRPVKSLSNYDNKIDNIAALIIASDLASFLTSYDYDSFGNPIAESIALKTAYITTSYARYQEVYGRLGYKGLIFPVTAEDTEQVDNKFADKVAELLNDKTIKEALISHNHKLMKQYLAHEQPLNIQLNQLLNLALHGCEYEIS